jgi:two-component system sensor histidine kinase and response regulator WspE
MSNDSGFGGMSLLELFKLEAEAHCAALGDGLLALEKSPTDRAVVEPLMRAAHSIKGAARIVGLDVIVTLAHVMEECFLAAKDGREPLASSRVDQLLKAVDVLGEVRALSEANLPEWTKANAVRIADLVAQLKAPAPASATPVIQPQPQPQAQQDSPPPSPAPSKEAAAAEAPAAATSVRVASSVMNRMLFLAGESTVEAGRLQLLREMLQSLKVRERSLANAVESMRESLRSTSSDASKASDSALTALVGAADGVQRTLVEQATRFDEAFRRVEELSSALYTEVLRSRLRPFAEGVTAFPRMVRDIARQLGKNVELRIEGERVAVDRDILQKLEAPLTHMIRNSLDHGIEMPDERAAKGKPPNATITLTAGHQRGMLAIEVRDDGRGIDHEAVRRKVVERRMVDAATAERLSKPELMEFLFLPGFSTSAAVTQLSGRGVGLDVVQSMVQEVSGTVALESEFGRGARFTLRLPVTRSVVRAALARIGDGLFALPLARLDRIVSVARADATPVQGRLQFTLDDRSIGLIHATELLGLSVAPTTSDPMSVVVIGSGNDRCGLMVDALCGEEDLVVRPLDPRIGNVPHIAAAAIRSDGDAVFVVDVDDLWRSVKQSLQGGRLLGLAAAAVPSSRRRGAASSSSTTRSRFARSNGSS